MVSRCDAALPVVRAKGSGLILRVRCREMWDRQWTRPPRASDCSAASGCGLFPVPGTTHQFGGHQPFQLTPAIVDIARAAFVVEFDEVAAGRLENPCTAVDGVEALRLAQALTISGEEGGCLIVGHGDTKLRLFPASIFVQADDVEIRADIVRIVEARHHDPF